MYCLFLSPPSLYFCFRSKVLGFFFLSLPLEPSPTLLHHRQVLCFSGQDFDRSCSPVLYSSFSGRLAFTVDVTFATADVTFATADVKTHLSPASSSCRWFRFLADKPSPLQPVANCQRISPSSVLCFGLRGIVVEKEQHQRLCREYKHRARRRSEEVLVAALLLGIVLLKISAGGGAVKFVVQATLVIAI
ncbi:hypothetical protein AALP_AA6G109500 [Arabis alpina]|uniref:Uncharacterized protein n=1 Tax=Arabis alpina TaxID=50452 RepID=A0A087GNG7_ARAAL|nr:hypothetical protein AALP_AA6G109500 [Arabis alpina]